MLETLLTSAAAFAATNIDDIFILMLLLARCSSPKGKIAVTAGHTLGIGVLTVCSLLGALGLQLFPADLTRLLGLIPLLLGLKAWLERKKEEPQKESSSGLWGTLLLTVANGADNIGVYIPLFTGYSAAQRFFAALLFALFSILWSLFGELLTRLPGVQKFLQKYKNIIMPAVLILLGLYILFAG